MKRRGKEIYCARRFMQNTPPITNYYFNANDKLNAVIARGKAIIATNTLNSFFFYIIL
jgi:hypothetical protein